jgi:hypothetical protein
MLLASQPIVAAVVAPLLAAEPGGRNPTAASAMAGLLNLFQSFRTFYIIIASFPSTATPLDTGQVRVTLINLIELISKVN